MGLRPISMLPMAYVEWERIFDIYHIFGHMPPRLSSLLANSILANELYVPEIVLSNDSRIFLHATQLTHTEPLNALGTEGKVLCRIACTGAPQSG